jgi:predicted RNA methylase
MTHNPPDMYVLCSQEGGAALVRAECRALTGGEPPEDGFALCPRVADVERAAGIRFGGRLLAQAATLDGLVERVRSAGLDADGFRVEFHRLAGAVPAGRKECVVAVADALEGFFPDLSHPKRRFALFARRDGFWFGDIRAERRADFRRHDAKPYHTSSSLPSRLARVLVNLAARPGDVVLDPCCGAGSILLEAAAIGAHALGADRNPRMVGMARQNLAHFGYEGVVQGADATDWQARGDAVVTDLPYGVNAKTTEENIRGILDSAARMAPKAVFVAADDLSDWLTDAGYENVEVIRVPKHAAFVRVVHMASIRAR